VVHRPVIAAAAAAAAAAAVYCTPISTFLKLCT